MTWLDAPLLAIDTETTGTDPETARVLQVTLGHSDYPGGWHPVTGYLYNPAVEIPAASSEVHHLTADVLRERSAGVDPVAWVTEAHRTLSEAAHYGTPIVGHNLRYDLTVLDREFDRYGVGPMPSDLICLDTLILFRRLDWSTGGRTLSKLAERNGITFPAHDAEADALASLRLLHIIARENELLPHIDPSDIHRLQVGWYAAQQERARGTALGNGRPYTPAPGWPLARKGA